MSTYTYKNVYRVSVLNCFLKLNARKSSTRTTYKNRIENNLSLKILPFDYGITKKRKRKREPCGRTHLQVYVYGTASTLQEEKRIFNVAFISFSVYFSRHFFSFRAPPPGKTFAFFPFRLCIFLCCYTTIVDDEERLLLLACRTKATLQERTRQACKCLFLFSGRRITFPTDVNLFVLVITIKN